MTEAMVLETRGAEQTAGLVLLLVIGVLLVIAVLPVMVMGAARAVARLVEMVRVGPGTGRREIAPAVIVLGARALRAAVRIDRTARGRSALTRRVRRVAIARPVTVPIVATVRVPAAPATARMAMTDRRAADRLMADPPVNDPLGAARRATAPRVAIGRPVTARTVVTARPVTARTAATVLPVTARTVAIGLPVTARTVVTVLPVTARTVVTVLPVTARTVATALAVTALAVRAPRVAARAVDARRRPMVLVERIAEAGPDVMLAMGAVSGRTAIRSVCGASVRVSSNHTCRTRSSRGSSTRWRGPS